MAPRRRAGGWLAAALAALLGCHAAVARADGGVLLSFPGPQIPVGGLATGAGGVVAGLLGHGPQAKSGALYLIRLNAAGQPTDANIYPFDDNGAVSDPLGAPMAEPGGGFVVATGWGGVEWLGPPQAGGGGELHATLYRFAPGSLRGVLPLPDGTMLAAVAEAGSARLMQLLPSSYRPGQTPPPWTARAIYSFPHGCEPTGALTQTPDGAVFAVTRALDSANTAAGLNALYRLAPAPAGWRGGAVLDFHSPTDVPEQPVSDPQGRLYATVPNGGGGELGTVVRLSAAAAADGAWRAKELYHFGPSFGARPLGRLARDAAGALYGGSALGPGLINSGSLWRLTPPAQGDGAWVLTPLVRLTEPAQRGLYPIDGMQRDAGGNLLAVLAPRGGGGFGNIVRITP